MSRYLKPYFDEEKKQQPKRCHGCGEVIDEDTGDHHCREEREHSIEARRGNEQWELGRQQPRSFAQRLDEAEMMFAEDYLSDEEL